MRISKMPAKVQICSVFLTALCATLFLGTTIASQPAEARSVTYNLDIPAQNLNDALQAFALASQHKLLYSSALVDGKRSPALKGQFTTEQAVKSLLSGTHLDYEVTSDGLVLIRSQDSPAGTGTTVPSTGDDQDRDSKAAQEGKKSSSGEFRVAQVDQRKSSSASPLENRNVGSAGNSNSSNAGLSEIIVTAQKKSERALDVPIPVTVLNTSDLVQNNQLRLQDYFSSVPGLTVAPVGIQSSQILKVRGLSGGIVVDDIPYGSSTVLGGNGLVPDIDPGDLASIEVLRGPQGTLYGANSVGGLIKYVTIDPSTDALSGRVEAGASDVHNGAQLGYTFRASVNAPLSDSLAIRASAFTRQDPGYIDNPVLNISGINESRTSGARIAALWSPGDVFLLKLSALYQDTRADGSSDVDVSTEPGYSGPPLGDLQQNYLRGIGGYDRKVQAYSAIATAKLGRFDLTSLSGFNINSYNDSWDYSNTLGGAAQAVFGVPGGPILGSPVFDNLSARKVTEELRLRTSFGSHVEWLVGVFYTHEHTQAIEVADAEDSTTGAIVGNGINIFFPTTYQEYAVFTDLTFRFTDRFDVQVGGRESHITQDLMQAESGAYVTPYVLPEKADPAHPFTYLVTPRFKLSEDLMLYARFASGYEPGGINPPGTPQEIKADTTKNYELGIKGDLLEHTLSFSGSVYYIDWTDIPESLVFTGSGAGHGLTYTANAGAAKSEGVEVSVDAKPTTSLTLGGWVAWNEAVLTKPFPPGDGYGVAGSWLPYASRYSGSLSASQEFNIAGEWKGFAGGAVSYVGKSEGPYTGTSLRQIYGDFAKADFRLGAKTDLWTINAYVNNLADRRGALNGGIGTTIPFAFQYIQPRTVGVSLIRKF